MAELDPPVHGLPEEVAAIRREISAFLDRKDASNRKIGNSTFGVYIFYDYDGEPIYVGQTKESLRSRISRHLTNQRTDAVAMSVLDPFEVAEIEVWPLDDLFSAIPAAERAILLDKAEFTVFQKAIAESRIGVILNEKAIFASEVISLPASFRGRIIPESIYPRRKHPDIRTARRAATIAALARVISERDVSDGLRRTLLTQARRLELLASERLAELKISETRQTSSLPTVKSEGRMDEE